MNTKFPEVYACFDTARKEYVRGAKGQEAFCSVSGLKRSISQEWRSSFRFGDLAPYFYMCREGLMPEMIKEYEALLDPATCKTNPQVCAKLRDIFAEFDKIRYSVDLRTQSFPFNKQTRFVIHTLEGGTVKTIGVKK